MYNKNFTPLESDPEFFSQLIYALGVEETLEFVDVYSLDDDDLQLINHPVLAVIVIFPEEDITKGPVTGFRENLEANKQGVVWIRQTINNACGLYAILHAVCNGPAKAYIEPGSIIEKVMSASQDYESNLSTLVEDSKQIELEYTNVSSKGTTSVGDPTDEVDHHYLCFTKATQSSLWLLDGDREGPLVSDAANGDEMDVLVDPNINLVRRFIMDRNEKDPGEFSMMALVQK